MVDRFPPKERDLGQNEESIKGDSVIATKLGSGKIPDAVSMGRK